MAVRSRLFRSTRKRTQTRCFAARTAARKIAPGHICLTALRGPSSIQGSIAAKAQLNDALFFAILDNSTGEAVGHQAFHRIEPTHRVIEVGHILYTPRMQRTIGATEAQYLFAAYVFDALGYRRYEWRCDDLNAASKRAAARFGFTFEGVFRQHMIIKGRNRDTAWFSMLDSEWPARRAAFERWLDPANFDAAGARRCRSRA